MFSWDGWMDLLRRCNRCRPLIFLHQGDSLSVLYHVALLIDAVPVFAAAPAVVSSAFYFTAVRAADVKHACTFKPASHQTIYADATSSTCVPFSCLSHIFSSLPPLFFHLRVFFFHREWQVRGTHANNISGPWKHSWKDGFLLTRQFSAPWRDTKHTGMMEEWREKRKQEQIRAWRPLRDGTGLSGQLKLLRWTWPNTEWPLSSWSQSRYSRDIDISSLIVSLLLLFVLKTKIKSLSLFLR